MSFPSEYPVTYMVSRSDLMEQDDALRNVMCDQHRMYCGSGGQGVTQHYGTKLSPSNGHVGQSNLRNGTGVT
jgi:hypothetical protein